MSPGGIPLASRRGRKARLRAWGWIRTCMSRKSATSMCSIQFLTHWGSARRQITSSMPGLLMAARPSAASHVAMTPPHGRQFGPSFISFAKLSPHPARRARQARGRPAASTVSPLCPPKPRHRSDGLSHPSEATTPLRRHPVLPRPSARGPAPAKDTARAVDILKCYRHLNQYRRSQSPRCWPTAMRTQQATATNPHRI